MRQLNVLDKNINNTSNLKFALDSEIKRYSHRLIRHMLFAFSTIGAVSTGFVLKNAAPTSNLFFPNNILNIFPDMPIDIAIKNTVAICFSILGAELTFFILTIILKKILQGAKNIHM